MRLLHYIEIKNFKRFGGVERIELDHPSVIVGPNNSGKTTVLQAIALWSQAVRTWIEARRSSNAKERTATAINRLNILAVPVQRTRYFWHNTQVRTGNRQIQLVITVGVEFSNRVMPVSMSFRNQGDELVYSTPIDEALHNIELLEFAAKINVELLYPMSGLETEEPVLQPGRIDVLLGQGQTAQVLRNLCLMVHQRSADDWKRIQHLMYRLFSVNLGIPQETTRGSIELNYRQGTIKDPLDISLSGRGFQQILLIFSYLYSHKRSVLLVDEPDAHLEILRQKQIYVLLRDIASDNGSQVVMVTHSEIIIDEAADSNLTLLLAGRSDNLAEKKEIIGSLKHFGTANYIRASERGYVLYVEGGTDLDILRALAEKTGHPILNVWDERINSYYIQNNYPEKTAESELDRVEGGFGVPPKQHFFRLRAMVPELRGLAILDSDSQAGQDSEENGLKITHWKRYEAENYFITPDVLMAFTRDQYREFELFIPTAEKVLNRLTLEQVFGGNEADFNTWRNASSEVRRLIWESKTERIKLSSFAESYFKELSQELAAPLILRKGEFHRMVAFLEREAISDEVTVKLNDLQRLFAEAKADEEGDGRILGT